MSPGLTRILANSVGSLPKLLRAPRRTALAMAAALALVLGSSGRAATNLAVSTPYRPSASAAGNSQAPILAADGGRVVFLSHAANLVTNEDLGPHLNLFARDLFSPNNTLLISSGTNGRGANASVTRYSIGSIGWAIAFETAASNLTQNDTNDVSDVFAVNFQNAPVLISVNAAGTAPGNGRSYDPIVSRYGERVVFVSEASDLVPNDTNGMPDVFVRDVPGRRTFLASVNAAGDGPGNGPSHSPYLTEYGGHVAFISLATNLVSGVTNTLGEVYVRDINNNTTRWAMAGLTLNSPACLRQPCPGWPDGYAPSDPITFEGGRVVIFKLGRHSIVRWDYPFLGFTTNARVHRLALDQGETLAPWPLMPDYDASMVGYAVGKTNAAGEFTNTWLRRIDFRAPTTVVIPPDGGGPSVTTLVYTAQNVVSGPPVDGNVFGPSMSSSSSRFFFASDSTRLVSGVTNGSTQVYYHETGAPFSVLVSVGTNGAAGPDLNGVLPSASRQGQSVVWDSPDASLVPDDLNGAYDVFLRDLNQNRTTLLSGRHPSRPTGTSLRASRLGPGGLSGNGYVAAFTALDSHFVAGDTNRRKDVLVLNLVSGGRTQLTMSGVNVEPLPPALNADGRFAVFEQVAPGPTTSLVTNTYRADLLSNTLVSVAQNLGGATLPAGGPSMTPDGRFVAFHTTEPVFTLTQFGPGEANPSADVLVRDFNPPMVFGPRTNYFVASLNRYRSATGNAESRAPAISADGRWVAYHSLATDLTYDAFPAARHQVFAYDRSRGAVKLLSYTPGAFGSNATALPGTATNPVFSANSRFVFFTVNSNAAAGSLSNLAIFRHDLLNDPIVTTTNWTNGPFVFGQTNLTRLTNAMVCAHCAHPAVSADGRLVAYESAGPDGATNVVVSDLLTGTSEFISLFGNVQGIAHRPVLSLDGRYVVFTTRSTGPFLDTNNASDVFVQDRRTRTTHLVSRAPRRTGPQTGPSPDTGNGRSMDPVMSYDGRLIAFHSFASDLVPGDYNNARDVFMLSLNGADTDHDGLGDDWELAYFGSLATNGAIDSDGDGHHNRDEFQAGTDPTDRNSVFQVLVLTLAANWAAPVPRATITVFWSAVPGKTYRVQSRSSVAAPWTDVAGDVQAFTPSASKTFEWLSPPNQSYFRAMLVP